ncbi:glycosyltransferase family 2 protein [Planctomycetota bacterium]|nr:glycosyltransferase family 2 protein [Planctomycetota bacterium]
MPVFNRELYLDEAIQSILNQTFSNFEFIIINDGSTDNTSKILSHYKTIDSRIIVKNQENSGNYAARNHGMQVASSSYIAVMDSDDIAHSKRLDKQYNFLQSNPDHVAVGSDVQIVDPFGICNQYDKKPELHRDIDESHMRAEQGAIHHPTLMIRTRILKKIGGYVNVRNTADYDLTLKLAEYGKIANLPLPLMKWRRHPDSITSLARHEQIQRAYDFCKNAHIRRGIPFELNAPCIKSIRTNTLSEADQCASWARHAINQGQLKEARIHAINALKREPFKVENWRTLKWSLTG